VPLDVEHQGLPGAICVYYLERPEPTLVDPGPSTSLDRLLAGLEAVGVAPADLRHVLLTHVHLDHAGASGHLARANPGLAVHVHADAARHLADPGRLVASTRRTFGEAHDRLWGEVLPVPAAQLRGWRPGDPPPVRGLRALPTPGHIAHHLAWEAERIGVLFSGDSLGIVLDPDGPSHPATPAPGVDLDAWYDTLDRVLAPVEVDAFGATHFGLHPDLRERRRRLREALEALALRVDRAMSEGPGAEEADREAFHRETLEAHAPPLSTDRVERYFNTFSARTDWDGMRFHLERTPGARPTRSG
jgi:glyoxylase-like metal-dependent hydrolase (beta-lactamase superfamily II)